MEGREVRWESKDHGSKEGQGLGTQGPQDRRREVRPLG